MTNEERTIYRIAYHLRIPVYKLVQEMPYDELNNWCAFFSEFPPDDAAHADYRAAMIMRVMGFKGDPAKVFPSLIKQREEEKTVNQSIEGSFMHKLMMSASGGEVIPL